MVASVYDISNWNIKQWIATIGTRDKYFVENPSDEKLYFFKESISKFPAEFWSEIIASKVGKELGFNILDYNIAILNDKVGCLCESMIDQTSEELEHGINLLKNVVPNFKITSRPNIYFSDVEKSFLSHGNFINNFIEILIFDSIVGNQDRHSENWAIIRSLDVQNIDQNKNRILKWVYKQYKNSGSTLSSIPFKKFFMSMLQDASLVNIQFSPIYDSGSSLGREIADDKIEEFINNQSKIEKYIQKGLSEVRWENEKINHFELLKKVKTRHPQQINHTIDKVKHKYNQEIIKKMIYDIDNDLSIEYRKSKLTLERKELIYKFIDTRIKALIQQVRET